MHQFKRQLFAAKQKKLSDIVRWNAENLALFGSKLNINKNCHDNGSEGKKKTKIAKANDRNEGKKETSEKKKKVSSSANSGTKKRLEEMYLMSLNVEGIMGCQTYPSGSFDEGSCIMLDKEDADMVLDNSLGYGCVDADFNKEDSNIWPSETSCNFQIPKILPIPNKESKPEVIKKSRVLKRDLEPTKSDLRKVTAHEPAVSSQIKVKTFESTLSAHGKVKELGPTLPDEVTVSKENGTIDTDLLTKINFVLRCPLIPTASEDLSGLQEFKDLVKSLNLRILPNVNAVISKTRTEMSTFFLQRWRDSMVQELGEDGFKKHQEGVIWRGVSFHACVLQFLSGIPLSDIQIPANIKGHWSSLTNVLPQISHIQALETNFSHPLLLYKGTFDCIAQYKNMLYVIDWKTSSKPKPLLSNLYDNPLQVAAYLGAINANVEFTSKFGFINQAAIIVAYENGEEAQAHIMKPALCQHYWTQWCQRLHQYWTQIASAKFSQ